MSSEPEEHEENKTQKFSDVPIVVSEPNTVKTSVIRETITDSGLVILEQFSNNLINEIFHLSALFEEQSYDIREDFEWYTSGEVDTESYSGQYIAIWRRQIVGSGETALEAEMIAKTYCGPDITPAIVFVPENEDAIL